jgi:sigma-E factor negative regulatory protein RseC
MEQTVRVRRILPDGSAEVVHIRQSACSGDCHKCSGCGAAKETLVFRAENPVNAQVGDDVIISSRSDAVLRGAAVLYMLPLVLFIAGYLLGMQWKLGGLIGALAFALSIGIVVAYDRLVMKKKNTVYTITGYVHNVHS